MKTSWGSVILPPVLVSGLMAVVVVCCCCCPFRAVHLNFQCVGTISVLANVISHLREHRLMTSLHEGEGVTTMGTQGSRVKVNKEIPETQNFFNSKTYFFYHPRPFYFLNV